MVAIIVGFFGLMGGAYTAWMSNRNTRVSKEVEYAKAELNHIRIEQKAIIESYRIMADENRKAWKEEYAKRIEMELKLEAAFREIDSLKHTVREQQLQIDSHEERNKRDPQI